MHQSNSSLFLRGGFTLIEVLLCVGIMSALGTVAVIAVTPSKEMQADMTTDKIVQALRFAQQEAFATGTPTFVQFDTGLRTLEVYQTKNSLKTLVNHPLEKRPYSTRLASAHLAAGEIKLNANFLFVDGSTAPLVGFNATGQAGKLSGTTFVPIYETGTFRGEWQAGGTDYSAGDWVIYEAVPYNCLTGHKSTLTFALTKSFWQRRTDATPITVSTPTARKYIHVAPGTGIVRLLTL